MPMSTSYLTDNDPYLAQQKSMHDQRYFAMLNNAVSLAGTSFEGGDPNQALAYYQYLLNLQLPNEPVGFQLTTSQAEALQKKMTQLVQMQARIEKQFKDKILNTNAGLDQLLKAIDEAIQENQVCYLPSGWQNENGGHFAGLKIRALPKGLYAVSVLNHGAGMQYHRQTSMSINKVKRSYQSEEYLIDLQTPVGRDFLQRLLELCYGVRQRSEKNPEINPYSEHDLYGLLQFYGECLPLSRIELDKKSVTPQRTGTCSVTNVHAIARDILIDAGADLNTRKRYHFVIKMRSLLDAFYQYRHNHWLHALVAWGAREFGVRANKLYRHVLNEVEITASAQFLQAVNERLTADEKVDIAEKSAQIALPSFEGTLLKYPDNPFETVVVNSGKQEEMILTTARSEEIKNVSEVIPVASTITPENIIKIIENLSLSQAKNEASLTFQKLVDFFYHLPQRTGLAEDPFWDKVPVEEIPTIIDRLLHITWNVNSSHGAGRPERAGAVFAISCIAYDIAAQLASRCDDFKKSERYALALDDVYSNRNFLDPTSYHMVKRVVANFERRSQDKLRIFSNIIEQKEMGSSPTVKYLIQDLLSQAQRDFLGEKILKKKNIKEKKLSDEELFEELNDDLTVKDRDKKPMLPKIVRDLFDLSASIHAFGGNAKGKYQKMDNEMSFFFSKNSYYRERERKTEIKNAFVYPALPPHSQNDLAVHVDFSENTIYQTPSSLREKYISDSEIHYQPYQLKLSGSLKPESKTWNISRHEENELLVIDEQLRHIECTPDLQVIRMLDWALMHLEQLGNEKIQQRINELVFEYGKLEKAIANVPEATIQTAIQLIERGLKYYQQEKNTSFSFLIWLTHLSNALQQHIVVTSRLYYFSIQNNEWPNPKSLLVAAIKNAPGEWTRTQLAQALIQSFVLTSSLTSDDCAMILAARVLVNLGVPEPWYRDAWETLQEKMQATIFSSPDAFLQLFSQQLAAFTGSAPKQWHFRGNQLQESENPEVIIDLADGVWREQNGEKKDITRKILTENETLFKSLGLNSKNTKLFYAEKNDQKDEDKALIQSADGQWEFLSHITISYGEKNLNIREAFQIVTINDKKVRIKLLEPPEAKSLFPDRENPFESKEAFFDTFEKYLYQYWRVTDNPNLLFVFRKESPTGYLISCDTGVIQEYQRKEKIDWMPTEKFLLNLMAPKTDLEIHWAERLSPIWGSANVKVTTLFDKEKGRLRIEKIEHVFLNIELTLNPADKLICKEVPGYFLSSAKSVAALNGYPHVLVFENEEKDRKIMVPAFALNQGEENNAFNKENIVNFNKLCHLGSSFYIYKFDKHKNLIGNSIESNLYLAIIYRNQGDFKNAVRCLENCRDYKNYTNNFFAIAEQVMQRKIKSPMSAAFDVKLSALINEHRNKWSRKEGEVIKLSEKWESWINEQLSFYRQTFSNYKLGIAIVPAYCRLTDEDFRWNRSETKITATLRTDEEILNKRVSKINKKFRDVLYIVSDASRLKKMFKKIMEEKKEMQDYQWHSLRLDKKMVSHDDSLAYLIYHFPGFLKEAIATDSFRGEGVKRILFSILQQDKKPSEDLYFLLSLLVIATGNKNLFKEGEIFSDEPIACIEHVMETFAKNKNAIKQQLLIPPDFYEEKIKKESPKPSEFVEASVTFNPITASSEKTIETDLKTLVEKFFLKKSMLAASGDFLLDVNELKNPSSLEKYLLSRLKKGHQENLLKSKEIYAENTDAPLMNLINQLKLIQEKDKKELMSLEDFLIKKANQTPLDNLSVEKNHHADAYNLLLARAAEQRAEINLGDLFFAFLKKEPALLTAKNHFLTQTDIDAMFSSLADYGLRHTRQNQVTQILALLKGKTDFSALSPYEIQQVGEMLDKSRAYAVKDYPEFLVYEYATGRLLRAEQVTVLEKVIRLIEQEGDASTIRHGLLQFAAGGGKTSVLIPMLAHRFAQSGLLPVIVNTSELYQQGLADIPKSLRESFQQNLEVIECELDYPWKDIELTILLKTLKKWQKEKKCVLLKAVTWHSLNITMKSAYLAGDIELAENARAVLDFFKSQTVKLEDETHIVSDPLQQSIKTQGGKQKIPDDQLSLLLQFYDHLMGYESQSSDVEQLAGIKTQDKQTISAETLSLLQEKLARVVGKQALFQTLDQNALITYWLQPERKRPVWLSQLKEKDTELADLVVLGRSFLKTHLPHILSMQYLKDYGASIHLGDLTVAPKNEGKAVTSHFGDPILVASLTIQLYEKRGLQPEQAEQLLDQWVNAHHQERQWNYHFDVPTTAERSLFRTIPSDYGFFSCDDLNATLKEKLKKDERFLKHPEVVKTYLTHFALKQINFPKERQTSTAAEMQAGFNRSLLLSATPGLPEIYPPFLEQKNCFLETSFEAKVVGTLLEEKNTRGVLLNPAETPKAFFAQMPPDLFGKMMTLIDRGALLTDFDVSQITDAYMDLSKHVIQTQGMAFFDGDKMRLKSKDLVANEIPIHGTAWQDALQSRGIAPEKFLFFLLFDLSKTTGFDVKRPYFDHAGLTVGKGQTVTETIQAAMRERQLLEENAQSISWVLFKSLYQEMDPAYEKSGVFDPKKVFYWMIKNEASLLETKLIQRAYQGIHQAVTAHAWELLFSQNQNSNGQPVNLEALKQIQSFSPFDMYEVESVEEDTRLVLQEYTKQLCSQLNLQESQLPITNQKRIGKVVAETSELVQLLRNPPKTPLNAEEQQEQQMEVMQQEQQQQQIKTRLDSGAPYQFSVEEYSPAQDNLTLIFSGKSDRYKQLQLPGGEALKMPPLLICASHFSTGPGTLKPIRMLVVKIDPAQPLQFLACTAAGAEYYTSMMNDVHLKEEKTQYMLLSESGKILHISSNANYHNCQKLAENIATKKMLSYINFLDGKISDPYHLSQVIRENGWTQKNYDALANRIANLHISRETVQLFNHEPLERMMGWRLTVLPTEESLQPSHYPKRLQAAITGDDKIPLSTLSLANNPVDKLVMFPTMSPHTALEGYLFGKKPNPHVDCIDEIKLADSANTIFQWSPKSKSPLMEEAIKSLKKRVLQIMQSSTLALDKKTVDMMTEKTQFEQFSQIIETALQKVEAYRHDAPYLIQLKTLALAKINLAYQDYANGLPINLCRKRMIETLEALVSETKSQYGTKSTARFVPQIFHGVPGINKRVASTLAEILKETLTTLHASAAELPRVEPRL